MNKHEILTDCNFGERIAEEESDELERYFVETEHWRQTYDGQVDVIYGPKGSGKSALYSLLIGRSEQLFDRDIIIVSAEEPRGTPVFRDLREDPPTTEPEFVGLWKLYFLTLIYGILQDYDAKSEAANCLKRYLEQANLVEEEKNLARTLRNVVAYVRSYFRPPQAVEGTMHIDPHTGLPNGFTGKISFSEAGRNADVVSVDSLLTKADHSLSDLGGTLWILLDRLDVAFAESTELEENALRALFRVYRDIVNLEHLCLKIFLRTDIWKRITSSGFREASHITRDITIEWNSKSLMNLVIRRALKNNGIKELYGVDAAEILISSDKQFELFYRIFPEQVDIGPNKSKTFDWILNRTADGTKETAPREIIHFLNMVRIKQLRQHEIGSTVDEEETLFSRGALRDALPEVSRVRLHQTLFAEYPSLRKFIEAMRGEKTLQDPSSLARIWNVPTNEAIKIADELVGVGFFEERDTKSESRYWVPFLYRDAAEMIQGTADLAK